MHPRSISIDDFTYLLPEEKIAKYPLAQRDASKLLIYENGNIKEDLYSNVASYLPPSSLLVLNDTKVIEARILFAKPSGGTIEIFCLEPHDRYADLTIGMLQRGKVLWKCLIGGASKWKRGQLLQKKIENAGQVITMEARFIEKQGDCFIIELSWQPGNVSFAEVLHHAGLIPLPPYLKRSAEKSDSERYQTIYAQHDGSVAAPTAGLHFTEKIFDSLKSKQIEHSYVTLHVGAGTFKPVKSKMMDQHEMHVEFMEVTKKTILQLLSYQERVFAVGTTSLRTLESLYWMGVKTTLTPSIHPDLLPILQWEVYDGSLTGEIPVKESLQNLLEWMEKNNLEHLLSKTQILIAPGYRPKMIKGLITNFHQPQSTLLLLVAALIGNNWKHVYEYAIKNNFRFLSYGDGCLLFTH